MKAALASTFLLMMASVAHGEDELLSVDAAAGTIIIQQKGTLKTYRLKQFTEITLNGQKATAEQLKKGMQVTVTLADPQTVARVTARGNAGTTAIPGAGPAGGKPTPFATSRTGAQPTRRIVLKALVDGDDTVTVQDGKLRIRHGGWDRPKEISVNGVKWKPEWKDNDSDDFPGFQSPLAPFTGANITVRKAKGRGEATVVEPPTEANGNKLIVHLQDEGGGASEFEVRITW